MWFMTIISLNENSECKMFPYHSQLVMSNNTNENLIIFATCNVVHKWLNMWSFVQLELWLYDTIVTKCTCVRLNAHFIFIFIFIQTNNSSKS
jgi:hypothetical protein